MSKAINQKSVVGPKASEILRSPPLWLKNALQGLAFWIGHRCSIYSGWELSEGALVGELCNLIHAHLGDDYSLRCEQSYTKFFAAGEKPTAIAAKARVDLSVWKSRLISDGRRRSVPTFALEVKRAKSQTERIKDDLKRLAAIVEKSAGIRAILCVISEAHLPKTFVTARGFRKVGVFPIEGTDCSYQVIGVLKASPYLSSKNIDRAHYCCAVEVLSNEEICEGNLDLES